MKKQFLKFVAKTAKRMAEVSSETTSFAGLYQPKTPKALLKPSKKNTSEVA